VTAPQVIPAGRFAPADFPGEVRARPGALVYFCCNVGDGDAQVLALPVVSGAQTRRLVVVDAAVERKVPRLLADLEGAGLVSFAPGAERAIALVVATHPHQDHIGGMVELFEQRGDAIAELWDPGYFHAIPAYYHLMAEVERRPELVYAHPASGLRRWIGDVALTVLSPSVQLRNRFDSYGVEINDSSISLRLDFPVYRYLEGRDDVEEGQPVSAPRTASLVLGADAQTLSWSYVLVDFPYLRKSETAAAEAIAAAQSDRDLLRAHVLKVSHHGSKHGVNLELVERIAPRLTLVSSVAEHGRFNFPHGVTQDLIREALDPSTQNPRPHPPDHELRLLYTADRDPAGALGTIALVMDPGECTVWRFRDSNSGRIRLADAERWVTEPW
jgi:hypothetical protein